MKKSRPNRTGLTLVEVLLSMAIVAMVVAALTQLQDGGARAAIRATLTAEASVLCQSELDGWLAGNYSTTPLDAIESIASAPEWTRQFSLQPLPSSSGSNLSLLTVRVFRGDQTRPQYELTRWVPARSRGQQP